MQLYALFRLAFASAPDLQSLTSLHNATRRSVLQKVRNHARALSLLVSTGFQVLFHSPPGVLFTFPSRYYALSVTGSYLALEGGPPCFPPDSSCPVVLWCRLRVFSLRLRASYPLWKRFPSLFSWNSLALQLILNPGQPWSAGLGSSAFARRYLRNRSYFLLLRVLRCFSSPGSLLANYGFICG